VQEEHTWAETAEDHLGRQSDISDLAGSGRPRKYEDPVGGAGAVVGVVSDGNSSVQSLGGKRRGEKGSTSNGEGEFREVDKSGDEEFGDGDQKSGKGRKLRSNDAGPHESNRNIAVSSKKPNMSREQPEAPESECMSLTQLLEGRLGASVRSVTDSCSMLRSGAQ
jgi:hypothetical protein